MNALKIPINGTFYFYMKKIMLRYYKKFAYLKCIYCTANVLYYLLFFFFLFWISKGLSGIAV